MLFCGYVPVGFRTLTRSWSRTEGPPADAIGMRNVTTSRDECVEPEHAEAQCKAILERVLRAYHRDEGHGGTNCIRERILDAEMAPVARKAFLEADNMPSDDEVLQVLDGKGMH